MASKQKSLSHVAADGRPRMVDVSAKPVTRREAVAECEVVFPLAAARVLRAAGMRSAKGAVVDTAIIAGVMAAKRTHELIPFCHALALEDCAIRIAFTGTRTLRIECAVALSAKTGAEMEAMVGASVAALTVYDMCKALSHEVEIRAVRLREKRGGRSGTLLRARK